MENQQKTNQSIKGVSKEGMISIQDIDINQLETNLISGDIQKDFKKLFSTLNQLVNVVNNNAEQICYMQSQMDLDKKLIGFLCSLQNAAYKKNNLNKDQLNGLKEEVFNREKIYEMLNENYTYQKQQNAINEIYRLQADQDKQRQLQIIEEQNNIQKQVNEMTTAFKAINLDERIKSVINEIGQQIQSSQDQIEDQLLRQKTEMNKEISIMQFNAKINEEQISQQLKLQKEHIFNIQETIQDEINVEIQEQQKLIQKGDNSLKEIKNQQEKIEKNYNDQQLKIFQINQQIEKIQVEINKQQSETLVESDINSTNLQNIQNMSKEINLLKQNQNTFITQNAFENYMNKNVYNKQYIDQELQKNKENFSKNLISLKQMQKQINELSNTNELLFNKYDIKLEEIKQEIRNTKLQIENQSNNKNNDDLQFNILDQKILKLQEFFIHNYQAKLNALGTTKGLECISCGEKDVNFKIGTQFLQGEDQQLYKLSRENFDRQKQLKEDKKSLQEIQNQKDKEIQSNFKIKQKESNKILNENNSVSTQKIVKKGWIYSYNSLLSQTQKDYQQIISKEALVQDHYIKQHFPINELYDWNNLTKVKQRPLTSISKSK